MAADKKANFRIQDSRRDAWHRLRGIMKDIYAEHGGAAKHVSARNEKPSVQTWNVGRP